MANCVHYGPLQNLYGRVLFPGISHIFSSNFAIFDFGRFLMFLDPIVISNQENFGKIPFHTNFEVACGFLYTQKPPH
jgi:hypothetical protein